MRKMDNGPMELPIPVRAGLLLIAAAACTSAADAIRWGEVVDGLQLGIGITSKPAPGLRVVLKNTSATVQEISTGFEEDPDPPSNLVLRARAPQGHELQIFDTIGAKYRVPADGDRGAARTLRLAPGAAHEFTYLLSQLLCVVDMTDTTLDKLLKMGYSVRASFGFRQRAVVSPELSLRK